MQNTVRSSDLVSLVSIRHIGILIALGTPKYLIRIFKQSINENDISISFFIHSLIRLAQDFNIVMMNWRRILRIWQFYLISYLFINFVVLGMLSFSLSLSLLKKNPSDKLNDRLHPKQMFTPHKLTALIPICFFPLRAVNLKLIFTPSPLNQWHQLSMSFHLLF